MVGNATVTAKYGPGLQATTISVPNVQGFYVDLARSVICFHKQNSDPTSPQQEFDLTGVATFTVTISGTTYTIAVS